MTRPKERQTELSAAVRGASQAKVVLDDSNLKSTSLTDGSTWDIFVCFLLLHISQAFEADQETLHCEIISHDVSSPYDSADIDGIMNE